MLEDARSVATTAIEHLYIRKHSSWYEVANLLSECSASHTLYLGGCFDRCIAIKFCTTKILGDAEVLPDAHKIISASTW